ncbi:beta-L-arabinofuranosidase domain-containing protein [Amycolatopsis kentuckyensis]|uniref:beta-L-arabinofuranosidase domain-containing protein n=1 Tax=Amycolatopsis kentuckyensis TaxID=218823 RepID=UPI000A3B3A09|nr:beta-L-arabinofuranosidase domain-containing protein [Amycolatopsis kentuckyensis]
MSSPLNRRTVLHAAALAAATPVLATVPPALAGVAAAGVPVKPVDPVPARWGVRPFALGDVKLRDGVFAAKRALMLDHARGYDVNRLLQVFRANAGLDTRGAVAPGGWEGLDGEANGNLRGHYTGHFLTMLAQAYAGTGEAVFGDRIRYVVGALAEVRDALRRDPAPLVVPGRFGSAIEQPRGSSQYVELPSTVLGNAAEVTIAAWVRPSHADTWARVFDFGDNQSKYLYLAARNGSGVPRFAITNGGAGREQGIDGTAALPVGEWSHLAVTITGTTGTLYVNGTVAGTNTAMTLNPAALGALANHWLGRSLYPDPLFAGAFGGFDVWSRALSTTEIGALQAKAGDGDLASYAFDTLTDRTGRSGPAVLRRTWGGPSHPGFLAAYPETQFITLESMTGGDYTVVWAPYYTAHKILNGLFAAYRATGDARALDLASGMCDWMYSRLSKLPKTTLQRMWGIFSSGEFGGIVETICDVHAVTGRAEHLALAKLFDLDHLIDSCVAGTDILTGMHANQHIPILTGLVRLYDETGEKRYLDAARGFWGMVVPTRMYGIGGTSLGEFWKAPGSIAGTLGDTNAETCCAYNMLKLSRMLFFHEQDPRYLDYYERALYNQVLGSKQDKPDAEKPLATYFIGLNPGHVRDYTPKAGATCCEGTGMESATKYQDTVYFRGADDSTLYVNLYSPSKLSWNGVTIEQRTNFPFEQGSTLVVRGCGRFTLRLRVPSWCRDTFSVKVNGKPAGPVLTRTWRDGDTVVVRTPFRLRTEQALDDPKTQTLFFGPVNLVARDPRTTFLEFGLYRNAALSGDLLPSLSPVPGKPLHFRLGDVEFAPFFEGTEDPTHAYFHRVEPTVVFGGLDSGIANPAQGGTTLLDDIWAGAPFASKEALLRQVKAKVDAWRLSAADAAKVLATARRAGYAR